LLGGADSLDVVFGFADAAAVEAEQGQLTGTATC
jgi:hypothetical protein